MKKIFQLDLYSMSVSEITNKTIYINDSLDQFLISPNLDFEAIRSATNSWIERVNFLDAVHKPPPKVRGMVDSLASVKTREEFLEQLELLVGGEFRDKLEIGATKNYQRFFIELMLFLWSYDVVAWPAKQESLFCKFPLDINKIGLAGDKKELIKEIASSLRMETQEDSTNLRFIIDQLLSRLGILEIGDITPTTFYMKKERTRLNQLRSTGMKAILNILYQKHYNETKYWVLENFGFFLTKMGRLAKDDNFIWLTNKDPSMKEWVELAKYHLETTPANFKKRKSSINNFLEHYVNHSELPRRPIEYFDIKNKSIPIYIKSGNKGRQEMGIIYQFLNQVLFKVCSQTDDNEKPVLMSGFANPLPVFKYSSVNKGETHRNVMPTHLIQLAMQILTEDDFAWPKKIGRCTDTINWKNPITKKFEKIWSPVRAFALVIKLLLPVRTYQIRMLDSGEGDSYLYTDQGIWIKNIGKHAPKLVNKVIEKGIFRKYSRKDGTLGTILFFNTNKTADINNIARGYVMPWERKEAIEIFLRLRDWQVKYNPVNGPTPWIDIIELIKTKHKDDLKKMGENYFLFRDPASRTRPDLPVTDVRVRKLWLNLMEELEARLNESGQLSASGEPIKLILTRDKSGEARSATFDLHSLRVTLITAMYESGIPPEYLAKIVGHASVIMTLYYTKIDAETISLKLDDALLQSQQRSQIEMTNFLKLAGRKELEQAVAFNSITALDVIANNSAGFLVMDHGICPVSAKRCNEGLEVHDVATNVTKCQAVPGGASNCTRCRFFLTGPAFLFGLEAYINGLSYTLKQASFKYEATQDKFDNLTDAYAQALDQKKPFYQQRELEKLESILEAATYEIDNLALSLQSAYVLLEQCIHIVNKTCGNEFSLVSVGKIDNLQAIFSEEHEFYQLNYICTKATVYESLNIEWKLPNFERARMFDRMLRNSGLDTQFSLLNDVDSLFIANAMSEFLYTRLGANGVHDLIDGRSTLRALGLDQKFLEKLNEIKPKKLINLRLLEHKE